MKKGGQAAKSYAMLAPSMILFGTFIVAPLILSVLIAFKHIDMAAGLVKSPWVGMQNFRDLFSNVILAERIHTAFKNTILFTTCFVPINLAVSLFLASFVHSVAEKRQAFYRAALYLPGVTSALIFAMIWKWIYDPDFGILNSAMSALGFHTVNWTGDPRWAMWAVIIAALGAGPGGNVLIYLSALGSVPVDAIESARIEGANGLQRWWFVTLPHLRPVTLYLLILNTIGSFQVFELVFILTSGGPAGSSTVIVYEIYDLAFGQGRYGPAAALSLILLAVVGVLAAVQFQFLGGSREEQRKPTVFERSLDALSLPIGLFLGTVGDAAERFLSIFRRSSKPGAVQTSVNKTVMKELPLHAVLLPVSLIFFIPMIWMFLSAFTPSIYLQATPPAVAFDHLSLSNYTALKKAAPLLPRWFWNSTYLSLVITICQTTLSCLCGYVFARLAFPGRRFMFTLLILSIMLPYQALIIPTFFVVSSGIRGLLHIDLIDSHWAIILPALCSPVGIFLMRQYIEGLPHELEEAARIDGCGEFAVWYRIVLPLCGPIMGAWAILTFTGAWKNFFWPFVVLGSEQLFTLEVGLQTLQQQNGKDYGLIMAGASASAIPMILIFFIFQKQIVRGLTVGAVKG